MEKNISATSAVRESPKENSELEYLNKCIEFMENRIPSKWDPAIIVMLKQKFLPRLKAYLQGVEVFTKDLETPETLPDIAERIMNETETPNA